MNKINKIKEWILINYTKDVILLKYNNYNKRYINRLIIKDVNNKFELDRTNLKPISLFIKKYVTIIIPDILKNIEKRNYCKKKNSKK